MCTIGAAINSKGLILFKNCDLKKDVLFFKPKKLKGKYNYLAFKRKNRLGLWAGINEFGLGIVAADTYTKKKYKAKPYTAYNIFKGYEKAVSDYKNVNEAINFLKNHFKNKVKFVPDLIIVADKNKIAAFEFAPKNNFGIKTIKKGFILRANQFKILKGGKNKKEDPESHIRFNNALNIIKKNSSLKSIMKLCRDHKNGPSKFSVCRHGKKYEFKTQASVIMTASKSIKSYYIINNYPCRTRYTEVKLC